jgi:hypothetical protein
MLWGAALAAGAQAYRLYGAGAQAETQAVVVTQKLIAAFLTRNKSINCGEITDILWKSSADRQMMAQVLKFFLKGGPLICFSNSAAFARMSYHEIDQSLPVKPEVATYEPASCAALLVRKMGGSDQHAVMAAGFAGGIGLSGGACGALGAAVWMLGIQTSQETGGKPGFENPKAQAALERYLEASDYEFECAKVVGRQFEDVADHAEYLRGGGCARIIEALSIQS